MTSSISVFIIWMHKFILFLLWPNISNLLLQVNTCAAAFAIVLCSCCFIMGFKFPLLVVLFRFSLESFLSKTKKNLNKNYKFEFLLWKLCFMVNIALGKQQEKYLHIKNINGLKKCQNGSKGALSKKAEEMKNILPKKVYKQKFT